MQEAPKKKKTNIPWAGIIFLLIFATVKAYPTIAPILSQFTGGTIPITTLLPFLFIGIFLIVVISTVLRMVRAVLTGIATISQQGEQAWPDNTVGTRYGGSTESPYTSPLQTPYTLPQSPFTTAGIPQADSAGVDWDDLESLLPETSSQKAPKTIWNSPIQPQPLPDAPRFEPLISAKAVIWSIIGASIIGGGLLFGGWLRAILP